MRVLLPAVFLLFLLGASCHYSEPKWVLVGRQSLITRDVSRFVVSGQAALVRTPEGFVAQFPDGGAWQFDEEKVCVWQFQVSDLSYTLLAEIPRPKEVHSGFQFFGEGWDQDGSFYISVSGNRGKTSDTPRVKRTYRIERPGQVTEIASAPDVRASVQHEALANEKLLVDLDQKPGAETMRIGISRNYKEPYRYEFEMLPDGAVRRISE